MAKPKQQETVTEPSKKSPVGARPEEVLAKHSSSGTGQEQRQEWLDIAQKLEGHEFASLEEAMESVVNEVLLKLGETGKSSAEVREFLNTLLATDPALQEELRRILKC